jgi:demethylmenaquinone methyltransferase/2-methoxy-6-polyprenyl-1,4-benzoquinol methylase
MSLKPMFARVVKRYDFLNHLLTWGFDTVWRKTCAKECTSGQVIIDLCCGTGDLALNISKLVALETTILAMDFSKMMLKRAKAKEDSERRKRDIKQKKSDVNFILADATHLPLNEGIIDRICISFSFRNLIYKNPKSKTFLMEILRTLRLQGRFVFVETSQPKSLLFRVLYHLYLSRVVPLVGWLISGNKGAYHYLGISATNFPSAEEVSKMLSSAGFRNVSFRRITFGAVALHVGEKQKSTSKLVGVFFKPKKEKLSSDKMLNFVIGR